MPFWPQPETAKDVKWLASIAHHQKEWEKKAEQVEDGKLLPIDAEQWAIKEGLPPFVRKVDDPAAVFDQDVHSTHIPLSLATMWIRWRDREKAGNAWLRYCVWGRRMFAEDEEHGQPYTYKTAEFLLRDALRLGSIAAVGIRKGQSHPSSMTDNDWLNVSFFHDGTSGLVGPSVGEWTFGDVMLPKAVVLDHLWKKTTLPDDPVIHPLKPTSNTKLPPKRRGPRPIKTKRIAAEMLTRMHQGEEFSTWKDIALAAEFGGARGTCLRALEIALSEFQRSNNSDKH